MIVQIFGFLIALSKLLDHVITLYTKRRERAADAKAILTLKDYRARLEKSVAARRKAAFPIDDRPSQPDSLPDDGFRRD